MRGLNVQFSNTPYSIFRSFQVNDPEGFVFNGVVSKD